MATPRDVIDESFYAQGRVTLTPIAQHSLRLSQVRQGLALRKWILKVRSNQADAPLVALSPRSGVIGSAWIFGPQLPLTLYSHIDLLA